MIRHMTREQFWEAWREECREFLRNRCTGFGSALVESIQRGELVVDDERTMRDLRFAVGQRANALAPYFPERM